MELYIRHYFRDLGDYYMTNFFHKLYEQLRLKYPNIDFKIINEPDYEIKGYGSVYSCLNFSIINPNNSKYIVVSSFDNWKYHFMHSLGWKPDKMVQWFYNGGFNFIDYFNFKLVETDNIDTHLPNNIKDIYRPFFYNTHSMGHDTLYTNIFQQRDIKKTKPHIYFRGHMWDFRKRLISQLKKDSNMFIVDRNTGNDNNLTHVQYMQDMSEYRCSLGLPGGTEICQRDIESFAVGIPVIRPHLDIIYPDPLISNYHYINCYYSCKYWEGHATYINPADFQKQVLYYWDKIKDNFEYLEFVSTNARNWYVRNCTLNTNIKYLLKTIDLELLYG